MSINTFRKIRKTLPEINSLKYFEYMELFVSRLERQMNIRVYGFDGYSRLAFYFLTPEGDEEEYPNKISFRTAFYKCLGI